MGKLLNSLGFMVPGIYFYPDTGANQGGGGEGEQKPGGSDQSNTGQNNAGDQGNLSGQSGQNSGQNQNEQSGQEHNNNQSSKEQNYVTIEQLNQTFNNFISKITDLMKPGKTEEENEEENNDENEDEQNSNEPENNQPEVDPEKIREDTVKEIKRQLKIAKAAKKKAVELNWPAEAITEIEDYIPTSNEREAVAYIETVHKIANQIATARFQGQEPGNSGNDGNNGGGNDKPDPREEGRRDWERRHKKS
ncbi:hypothetical protein BBF96_03470 [Anoxybacter fermentans]|uniref:Uncharacterized protein n=1 Tax=Anoxybacter fermentans TaxID=1323375 RepID=A0A3S9SW91_9FIRM|nr:hypothetical protein [Anoxybacter fermentans]AZR72522.1 hypothetical protein BBF96_03470 [Anoxybacter fermentans]